MAADAAVLINSTDANVVLPTFYLSKADEDAKKNPQKVTLGAACDRGVVKTAQPEVGLNAYSYARLKAHAIVRGMVRRGLLQFRSPSLDIVADLGT